MIDKNNTPTKDVCLKETSEAHEKFILNIHKSDETTVRPYIFDRKGKHISIGEWKRLNGDEDYRRIGLLEMGDFSISTVWLGVAHDGESIFETVVFSNRDKQGFGTDPIFEERYPTEEIAIGLHQILSRTITEIFNSTPCPSAKKRLFRLALKRLQLFLHPEEAEVCHGHLGE